MSKKRPSHIIDIFMLRLFLLSTKPDMLKGTLRENPPEQNERVQEMTKLQGAIIGGMCFLLFSVNCFAIEGLQVSIQSTNVVLSWPSVASESYIVQYRATMDASNSWQQLTNQYPADNTSSNITYFTNFNAVNFESIGINSGGGGGSTPPTPPSPLNSGSGTGGGSGFPFVPGVGFYQVVREGVHISHQDQLTSAILSGTITVSFEAGNDTGILSEALVQIDGTLFGGCNPIFAPPTAPWSLNIDTAYLENGTHNIQAEVDWMNPDISDINNYSFDSMSDPVTVIVTNLISYPNWDQEIGTNCVFSLETVFTNAVFSLAIYDSNGELAQILDGQVTNGIIQASWDMTDQDGDLRTDANTDPFFYGDVTVYTNGMPAAQVKTPPKKQRLNNYPAQGEWAIVYQDIFPFMQNHCRPDISS